MSALEAALKHPANALIPLVTSICTEMQVPVPIDLRESECMIADPHIPEKTPSLHLSMGRGGVVFKRFGGDEAQGGAVELVSRCLNKTPREAAEWLIQNAGLVERSSSVSIQQVAFKPQATSQQALPSPRNLSPEERATFHQNWKPLTIQSHCPETQELERRGLLPALEQGLLRAYTTQAWQGRRFAKGALGFEIIGPSGEMLALRVRNLGKGQAKYSYPYGGKEHLLGAIQPSMPKVDRVGNRKSGLKVNCLG